MIEVFISGSNMVARFTCQGKHVNSSIKCMDMVRVERKWKISIVKKVAVVGGGN